MPNPKLTAEQIAGLSPIQQFDLWRLTFREAIAEIKETCRIEDVEFAEEVDKMRMWIIGNPGKAHKRDWKRFICGWLMRRNKYGQGVGKTGKSPSVFSGGSRESSM